MKTILILIMASIATVLGVYGYNQEMRANALQTKLEEKTTEISRLVETRMELYQRIEELKNRIASRPRNNHSNKRIQSIPTNNYAQNQTAEENTYICKAKDGGYYYSSSPCGTTRNVQKADLFLNQIRTTPDRQQHRTSPTSEKPRQQALQKNTQSDYSRARERLSKQCDHLKYGSMERRNCRKRIKQNFSKTCYSKREMPKYLRSANCSLADSFPVVE